MTHIFCTDKKHAAELQELRDIHAKELAARDAEIVRLNRDLAQAHAPRLMTYANDGDGGTEYEPGSPSWT